MARLRILAAIAIVALAAILGFSAPARATEGHIYTRNNSTAYVWVTAYVWAPMGTTKIAGAWCVSPGKYDQHGLRDVKVLHVRFELSKSGCQREPLLLNVTRSFPVTGEVWTYVVSNSADGKSYRVI
jgi:hypothetical protein